MSKEELFKTPPEVIVEEVNRLGGVNKAAPKYGISPAKLSRWLNGKGYFSKQAYVKVAAQQQT